MPAALDKAALHATFDVLLRALAQPKAGVAPAAAGVQAPPDALVAAYQSAKQSLRDAASRDPFDALASVVGVGSVLFYRAEKGKNDRCRNYWDALEFITTCLSVGYDDCFAKTSTGKAIAAFVMTVGPSLADRIFDPPRSEIERKEAEAAAVQRAVVERLDAILEALRAGFRRATPSVNRPAGQAARAP